MRMGMIGLKGHQSVVLNGARQLGGFEVVAIAHDDPGDIERLKADEPMAKNAMAFANATQLLEHSQIDVCCVCDENGGRVDNLVALAERGVHIVTEKPLTVTLDELTRLRQALAKSKSKLTMLLTMRHEAKYITMRRLVQEGAVGTVCLATAQKSYRLGQRAEWQKSRARLGGIIPFIGIHALDLIRWTTGQEFTHVAAFHANLGKPQMKETEDHASVLVRLQNGGSATARLDYLRPDTAPTHGDDRLRIAGSDGVLEALGSEEELTLVTTAKPPEKIPLDKSGNLFVAFIEAIKAGQPLPISTEDCLRITEVVLRARDAADKKALVELPVTA